MTIRRAGHTRRTRSLSALLSSVALPLGVIALSLQAVWALQFGGVGSRVGTYKVPGVDALDAGMAYNAGTKSVTLTGSANVSGWDFTGLAVALSGASSGKTISDCLFAVTTSGATIATGPLDLPAGADTLTIRYCTFIGAFGAQNEASSIFCRNGTMPNGGLIERCSFEGFAGDPLQVQGGANSASTPLIVQYNYFKSGGYHAGAHLDNITGYGGNLVIQNNLCDQHITTGNNYVRIGTTAVSLLSAIVRNNVGIGKTGSASAAFQAVSQSGGAVSNVSVTNNAFEPGNINWSHATEDGIVACSGNVDLLTAAALADIPINANNPYATFFFPPLAA